MGPNGHHSPALELLSVQLEQEFLHPFALNLDVDLQSVSNHGEDGVGIFQLVLSQEHVFDLGHGALGCFVPGVGRVGALCVVYPEEHAFLRAEEFFGILVLESCLLATT